MTEKDKKNHNKDAREKKAGQPENQDLELWNAVTKDITPLKNNNLFHQNKTGGERKNHTPDFTDIDKRVLKSKNAPLYKTYKPENTFPEKPKKNKKPAAGIDHRTRQRLKRGQIKIDKRLDLHGKSQQDAYQALLDNIPAAYETGKRCILVITGKGQPRSGDPSLIERMTHIGVLKRQTPVWLSMPPLSSYILDIQPARPAHGGDGALYVLLRRRR
ncbi:MAG: Smr/MutS family protein [Alphaproteobacteria bacterium]